jgi:hypothetical protein
LVAWWLHPLAEMGEERGGVLLEAVRQEEWHTAGRQYLHDLVDHALRHGQGAVADVECQRKRNKKVASKHGFEGAWERILLGH